MRLIKLFIQTGPKSNIVEMLHIKKFGPRLNVTVKELVASNIYICYIYHAL
jgi:hypothetical protein